MVFEAEGSKLERQPFSGMRDFYGVHRPNLFMITVFGLRCRRELLKFGVYL